VEAFHRDPDSYQTAKKELKHAALEFHRFLELLKDYQVLKWRPHSLAVLMSLSKALNVTAIRKSVKKFEKTTGVNSLVSNQCIRLLILAHSSMSTTSITVTEYASHSAQISLVPDESTGQHVGYIK